MNRCLIGDCRDSMRKLISDGVRVQTCVTSPPYWGLRDYGHAGQLGLEPTPDAYVAGMVEVFGLVRELLADDGMLWLNLGDSYATGAGKVGDCPGGGAQGDAWKGHKGSRGGSSKQPHTGNAIGPLVQPNRLPIAGLKPKDLVGIPWRVAFALQGFAVIPAANIRQWADWLAQSIAACDWEMVKMVEQRMRASIWLDALAADGWYLRQDIIWHKPNPMPESVTDRCTKSHEYIFMMTKRARYFYDAKAIAEPVSPSMLAQIEQGYNGSATKDYAAGGAQDPSATKANILKKYKTPDGWDTSKGNGGHGSFHKDGREAGHTGYEPKRSGNRQRKPASERGCPQDNPLNRGNQAGSVPWEGFTRNKRSVWTVGTQPYPEAHFATFPQALIEPCILAGSRPGDIVLDPFFGSGTTGQVAQALGRQWIGCELNPAYVELQDKRTAQQGLVLA